MGHFKHPYIQIASQFNHFCNPKKAIKFFLSFSVLSIIFSLLPFLHSFHVYISTFPMKLFSYNVDKNYMFLLCNGLLVFIVKNSCLVGKSPLEDDLTEEHVLKKEDSRPSVPKAMDGNENVLMEVAEEKEIADWSLVTVGKRDEAEEEEEEGNDDGFIIIEKEEDEEGEESGLMSAEELNKRCDDFIRMVREGIKFEAYTDRNLILANQI